MPVRGRRLRRAALVAGAYVAGASLVLGVGAAVADRLPLPPLFTTLLAGLTVLGLPLALALAWRWDRFSGE